eukprot:s4812_g4.t1
MELRGKYDMESMNNAMLSENVKVLQNEVSARNQVIRDIETKFTEYLRGYYQSVNSEFQMLNDRLAGSTVEVREYQAELMVAAQDDEGSTMRIQDLEQKRNLAEDVAKRIYEKGMIMREEYQDQVDPDTDRLIRELRDALEKEKGDHAVTRSYYRQVDEAYNEEVREIERLRQGNGIGNDEQIPEPEGPPADASNQRGSNERQPASVGPVLTRDTLQVGQPSDPPPPPEPSTRGSYADDAFSQSNFSAVEAPRISRREADKVFVPAWPKVQDVVSWQSDVAKGVILAANDGDRAAWQEWLQPALARHPDLDALNDSGGQRFQSIDTKLSIALSNMIQQAGDVARNVSTQLRHRTQAAGRNGGFVMGREILAMVLNHFRTPGVSETLFTMEHLVKMTYYGDAHLDKFYDKWIEMVNNMRPEDVPPDDWLRRSLYSKIRHSNLLMFDIKQYESWEEGDERKTYRHLRNFIERTIARIKEDKHAAARDKYAREYAGSGKPGTPAPATPTPKAGNENAPDAKAKAKPKAKAKVEAAPVLPSPSPKNHAKGKGKGKGNGTPRKPGASQSPSPKDKKKIPCHFHFVKKACKKGKDCEYSHDQKVFDNMKKKKDGKNSRSQSPRSKSPANKPKKIDEPCWNWAKGSCKFGEDMINISSILHQALRNLQLHPHYFMILTVMMTTLLSKSHPRSQRRK